MSALVLTFDPALFRVQFPAYADNTAYPDGVLQIYWNTAINFVTAENYGNCVDSQRQLAINSLVAHLITLNALILAGEAPVIPTSAGVGTVTVSLQPPKTDGDPWQWWLATTPYGMQCWALLSLAASGGIFVGGSPERSAFRQVGGGFGSR